MEWEEIMINPETKLIKMMSWNHVKWQIASLGQIDNPTPCPTKEVMLVAMLDPKSGKQLSLQLICPTCYRGLILHGNTNNKH
jgi:hypothetical protein